MKRLRLLAAGFVVAVAGLGIWVASTGLRSDGTDAGKGEDAAGSAYDYEARDVVVKQMGPDGVLQYELTARQISQEPQNGRITATDLVMDRDPPGSTPGGPNRWTMRAKRADLPGSGDVLTLQGDVHAEGRPQNSRVPFVVSAEELTYNLRTEEVDSSKPVDIARGKSTINAESLWMNIRTGDIKTGVIKVNSGNGIRSPK